jgi:hypothetical protein
MKHLYTAIHYDESHINKYFRGRAPYLVLTPSYCYPEPSVADEFQWIKQFPKKILFLSDDIKMNNTNVQLLIHS